MNGRDLPNAIPTITARSALLFSDVHLSEAHPELTTALINWLTDQCVKTSNPPEQLLILGDLFDAWVGDDQADHPHSGIAARSISDLLRQIDQAGIAIGFIAGNRDFLVGADFHEIRVLLRQALLRLHPFELDTRLTGSDNIGMCLNGFLNRLLGILKKVYFRLYLFNRLRF